MSAHNAVLCVDWHDIEEACEKLHGIHYIPLWFVVDGEVHKGSGNGKFFTSEDDGNWQYSESNVSHFAFREPDLRPEPPNA